MNANAQTVRTTGAMPYLEYGTGTDRLGGARMTYLDTGVLLRVTDSNSRAYQVQLSRHHTAYIPKAAVRPVADSSQTNYLTGSGRVWGNAEADYISMQLPERLPYRSMQQLAPATIVVDVFGAINNTNWITQLPTATAIKNFWYEQIEDDVFRLFIQLNAQQHWGHAIYYNNNLLTIKVARQPKKLKLRNLIIAVDAGHGGGDSGAKGPTPGVYEKEYTLKFAQALQKRLQRKGVTVHMTRTEDTTLSMAERVQLVKAFNPHLLISLHLNSSARKEAKGVSTYYKHIGFRPLTQAILNRMLQLGLNNFGNIGAFNFALNGPTEYPNCLVEVAFISNSDDEQLIVQEKFQQQTARQIQKGIRDWLRSL